MSTPSLVSVILDDTFSGAFQYDTLGTWNQNIVPGTYLQSSHIATGTVNSRGDELNYVQILFSGVSLAIYGNTPPPTSAVAETFSVTIDGKVQAVNSEYGDPDPPSYRMWYSSPTLTRGSHNITLINVLGASIDYAVTQHSDNSFILAGQTVIVDNDDPSISYSGENWISNNATFLSGMQQLQPGKIIPYGGTTRTTNMAGDQFLFTFSGGTDLSIYGVMDWTQIGHLVLSVAVDGFFVDQIDFPVLLNTSEVVGGWGQETNFLFYKIPANVSTPGTHTVLVDVVECINQTFTFDYITYTSPSFTFEAIPSTPSGSNTKSRIGPIIGGAVGGLIFILLVALFLDCVRRRKRQVRTHFDYPFNHKSHPVNPIPLEEMLSPGDMKDDSGLDKK